MTLDVGLLYTVSHSPDALSTGFSKVLIRALEAPKDLPVAQSAQIESVIPVLSSSILPCGHTYNQHKILYQKGKMTAGDMACGICKGISKNNECQQDDQDELEAPPRPHQGPIPSQTISRTTEPFPTYREPRLQTQPIDIPAGDPTIQRRANYTGDALDLRSIDARRFLNPDQQRSASASYGLFTSGSSTIVGTSSVSHGNNSADVHPLSRNDPSSSPTATATTQAKEERDVAHDTKPTSGESNAGKHNDIHKMLAKYPMTDLRALFPGKSDLSIRRDLNLPPGTPTEPYYGKEYAEHAKATPANDDEAGEFVRGNISQEDPFTGDPDRSNLLFSASGEGILPGVVAASTPIRSAPPSRLPPPPPTSASAATRATEIIEELDRLAAAEPGVLSLMRASGYRRGGSPSLRSGFSGAAAAGAAPSLTSSAGFSAAVQGELLHQQDELERAQRHERRQARLAKKASKATLKSQKSVVGGGGGGLFGRFRRGGEGGGGPSAPPA